MSRAAHAATTITRRNTMTTRTSMRSAVSTRRNHVADRYAPAGTSACAVAGRSWKAVRRYVNSPPPS